jgi:hypothetical protein
MREEYKNMHESDIIFMEGGGKRKNLVASSKIEPATYRLVLLPTPTTLPKAPHSHGRPTPKTFMKRTWPTRSQWQEE